MRTITLVILLMAGVAQAQVRDMVPEAKTMPAPDWVKPGVRLTWHLMTAAREGASVRPSGPFGTPNAKDDKGNKYTTTKGGAVAGQGYTEIIIVAVEPKRVLANIRTYTLPGAVQRGPAAFVSEAGGVSDTPGMLADYYIHPRALHNLLARPETEHAFLVGRVKENVNGEPRDAISLGIRGGSSRARWVYDLESGVLLSVNRSSTGSKGLGGRGKDGTDYSGKTWGADHTSFRDFAQLNHPWLGKPSPDWVGTIKAMDFEGGWRMTAAAGVRPEPRSQRFEPQIVGRDWALMRRSMISLPRRWLDGGTFNGTPVGPSKSPFVTGSACPSGLWIAPDVLQKLERGQVVSHNPVTEFRATVHYVGAHEGRDVCVIRWENRVQTIDYVHDRKTGTLLRVWTLDRGAGTESWTNYVGMR